VRAKALDPFFTTKPIGQGTGLGLSTSFGFISQSRGCLEIDSAPGKGTTINILLPRTAPRDLGKT
jgi:signal transduction histidine kinase